MTKDASYEEMSEGSKIYEQSEVPAFDPPFRNKYEDDLASGKGFNQSGFKGQKK